MNYNKIKIYIDKGNRYIKKNIMFFNVKNQNIKELAYRDYCYRKLYKKYKYVLDEDYNNTDEKEFHFEYVWILWLQGIENAPELVKKCYESVKKFFPDKKIIVINENNYKDYIEIPEYIENKKRKGIISNAHFSDIIRVKLLNKWGGLWLDSTVYMTSFPDNNIFKKNLFVFKEISLNTVEKLPTCASNWLIYSNTNSNILALTEKLLLEYWKKENKLINYFIFHLFFTMAARKYQEEWNEIPAISNVNAHILQFELNNRFDLDKWNIICKMSDFHKLNYRIKNDDENSFYSYIIKGN